MNKCRACGKELDTPMDRHRGIHLKCQPKAGNMMTYEAVKARDTGDLKIYEKLARVEEES